MKIHIIAVSKKSEKHFSEAISEYVKRLSAFSSMKVSIYFIPPEKPGQTKTEDQIKEAEGKKILQAVSKESKIIALDIKGKQLSSEAFSKYIFHNNSDSITFVIGGHLGLSEEVLKKADTKISLSSLTLTHHFAKVLLLEQLYRAACIEFGKKYHR